MKHFLKKFGIFILWTIPLIIFLFCTSINEPKVNLGIVSGIYFSYIVNVYSLKRSYNNWSNPFFPTNELYEKFYKKFTQTYIFSYIRPEIFIIFFAPFFVDNFTYVLLYIFVGLYDLWNRRFISLDEKLNLLLEETNNFKNRQNKDKTDIELGYIRYVTESIASHVGIKECLWEIYENFMAKQNK